MATRTGIKDVAARAGVSVGTVSNVMNRPESVADETRQRVEEAIRDLGFVRNASARQLRAGHSQVVGVVVLDLSNPFYTELIRGIEDRLALDDHTLMVCSSDQDSAREQNFLRLFAEQGVTVHFVDITDLDEVALAVETYRPAALLIETVSNPLLKVADIGALAERAHAAGAALIVDNTFPTPYLCRPLGLGADYSVHSASKYIGGHGDVLALSLIHI